MKPIASRRSLLLGLTTASTAAALTLAGCGSGGSSANPRGVIVKFTICWPETDSRYIAPHVDLVEVLYWYTLNGRDTQKPLDFIRPTSGTMPTTQYVYGLPTNTKIIMLANGFVGYHDWLAGQHLEDNDANAEAYVENIKTNPTSSAPWVSYAPGVSNHGADGDTLVWNLVLASFAKAVCFDVTSEQTTEAAKPTVNNGADPRTCNLYTGLSYKITPYFGDDDGFSELAPDRDWAFARKPAYTFTDGLCTVPADAVGTTVSIAAAIQPALNTTVQSLADRFTWTSSAGASTTEGGTDGSIGNGVVGYVKNVAQTVTIAAPAHYIMDKTTFLPALTAAGSSVTETTVTVTTEWVSPEVESDYTFTFKASEGVNGVVNIS